MLFSFLQGAVASLLVAGAVFFSIASGAGEEAVRTTGFVALLGAIVALVLVNRSFSASVFTAIARPNRPMAVIFPVVALVAFITIAFAPARDLFKFSPIAPLEAACAALVGLATLFVLEGLKILEGAAMSGGWRK
jgi:Ca2+-transporting ATPase